MPKTSPHDLANRLKGGGGGRGEPGPQERVHRVLGVRTLDDVMFSLRKTPVRARNYELGGEKRKRDLEIERIVEDRLLTEYKDLGGDMISLEEAMRRTDT